MSASSAPGLTLPQVVALEAGEILSTHLIEADRRYWRNQRRDQRG